MRNTKVNVRALADLALQEERVTNKERVMDSKGICVTVTTQRRQARFLDDMVLKYGGPK